jgi:hypothetical protein
VQHIATSGCLEYSISRRCREIHEPALIFIKLRNVSGAGISNAQFLELDEVYKLLLNTSRPSSKIPPGLKEEIYFVVRNDSKEIKLFPR